MTFLRSRRNELTARFWAELETASEDAPAALQELARGDRSVVVDRVEADAGMAFARSHPAWLEDPAPVYVVET